MTDFLEMLKNRPCKPFSKADLVLYVPYDETKIKDMGLKETLLTLQKFQRDAWVCLQKIEGKYNRFVQNAIEHKRDAIVGWDGTAYPDPQKFKDTLYKPYAEGGTPIYGEWYMDTERVIPLLMGRLFELEQELHPTD